MDGKSSEVNERLRQLKRVVFSPIQFSTQNNVNGGQKWTRRPITLAQDILL